MSELTEKQILSSLLPCVAMAGDYALRIQSQVENRAPKDHLDSAFSQALTDADVSVQNFLEVAALARFPELGFFGEEHEQSANTKYFSENKLRSLLVDPVDGTRFYADGRPYFNVVLSLVDPDWYRFGILYIPAFGSCFHAVNGEGLYRATSEQLSVGEMGSPTTLNASSNTILTYRTPRVNDVLSKHFDVIDIEQAYPQDTKCPNINALFLGDALAFLGENNSAIDWGVHAFLAEEGGGKASDWSGASLPKLASLNERSFPTMLVSASSARHEEIVRLISGIID